MSDQKPSVGQLDPNIAGLLRAKYRFLIPVTLFFMLFYFALPLLTAYAPDWMNRRLWGRISIAWVFAFAQFGMTFALSTLYLWQARRFDRRVAERLREGNRGNAE